MFYGEPDKTIDASGAQSSIRLAILVRIYFLLTHKSETKKKELKVQTNI